MLPPRWALSPSHRSFVTSAKEVPLSSKEEFFLPCDTCPASVFATESAGTSGTFSLKVHTTVQSLQVLHR